MSDGQDTQQDDGKARYSREEALGLMDFLLHGEASSNPRVPTLDTCPFIPALNDGEQEVLKSLWGKLKSKTRRNGQLNAYYDAHASLRSLGISTRNEMRLTRAALGWPAKAVQALARKHVWEGYAIEGQSDPYDLGSILSRNRFALELSEGINAAYKHGVAFLVVGGDKDNIKISARGADYATALYDETRREITAALVITQTEEKDGAGKPTSFTLYLPNKTVLVDKTDTGWATQIHKNTTGRVLVEPLVYDPQLGRPFGHSRITREVRFLTDAAIRTMVRAEISSEFFAAPQRYALGVDDEAFDMDGWKAITGHLWAIDKDEDGDTPTVGQFPQQSMEPHLSMYRQLAQNFCSATNLPMSAVGLFSDNPASAEAMQAAEYALSDEAEYQWRVFESPLVRTLHNIIMLRHGLTEDTLPEDAWNISIKWTPARYVSPQASSDFIVKIASVMPEIAKTNVGMRRAGFTQTEIDEVTGQIRKAQALDTVERLAALAAAIPDDDAGESKPVEGGAGENVSAEL